jgi:uncharacterized protein (DUF2141 family)
MDPKGRWIGALALATCCPLSSLASGDTASAVLSVRMTGLHSSKGKVGCTLYNGPNGFPKDPSAAIQQRWCKIDGTSSACRLDPIPAGTYAVACFHDENDNGKLDTGWFGIPTEGTAVSNNAKGSLGPPKYDDAKFVFPGRPTELSIRMTY